MGTKPMRTEGKHLNFAIGCSMYPFADNRPDWFVGSIYSQSADGSINISGLGPGSYQLQIALGKSFNTADFQLRPQVDQQIELRLDADGKLESSLPENRQ